MFSLSPYLSLRHKYTLKTKYRFFSLLKKTVLASLSRADILLFVLHCSAPCLSSSKV